MFLFLHGKLSLTTKVHFVSPERNKDRRYMIEWRFFLGVASGICREEKASILDMVDAGCSATIRRTLYIFIWP